MYKVEQIDWEAVDSMVATQIAKVVDMIRELNATQEFDSKTFYTIKATIIDRTIDSILDQLYYAFRYEGDMECDQKLVDKLSAKLREALESDDVLDHGPIREGIKCMYRVRLLIEGEYINQRSYGIYTRLEELDIQTKLIEEE